MLATAAYFAVQRNTGPARSYDLQQMPEKILESKNKTIEDAIKKECKKLNFIPEYRSIHIYGICSDCQ